MMEEIDRFQVPPVNGETQPLDPAASSTSEADPDTKGETVAMNYKPSPLQVQIEKQRDLARKGSVKNGTVGSPVNQQPKKNARTRLVVPNKGYSSLDQSPDEKPLVALDTDSDDDFDMSRYSSSGYSSAEVRCLRDQVSIHTLYCSLYSVTPTSVTTCSPSPILTPGICAPIEKNMHWLCQAST
ncbi:protein FAM219A isoform X1 [Toxotes jaculatrix]|uniref:protein FAM219A isoform X1 n=1 Tax=Toxotes jaculatrix TaxID=941984 RepID=UPI001B3AABD5|nr:protein FAM219A isoform X1 [Toxotes jaculatrix]